MHTWVWPGIIIVNSNTSDISLMNLMTVSLQNSQHFLGPVTAHCCPLHNKFRTVTHFSSQQTAATIFPADSAFFNCFFVSDVVWHRSTNCHLDSSSKWWTHISSHVKICGRKPSTPVSYQCKLPVLIASLTSLCTFVSMHGTKQVQTLEHLSCVH